MHANRYSAIEIAVSFIAATVFDRFIIPSILRRRFPAPSVAALRILRRGVAPASRLQGPPVPSTLPTSPSRSRTAGAPVPAAPGARPGGPPGGAHPLHRGPRGRLIQGRLPPGLNPRRGVGGRRRRGGWPPGVLPGGLRRRRIFL